MDTLLKFCLKYKVQIILILLFAAHLFLRFYLLFEKANFGWDQIDSAWAAKDIIANKHFLINGPVAKGNSGIYMGPLYYYLITIVYFFTNLDPIASPIFAGLMSAFNLFIVYQVTKKIFGTNVALVACFINIFSNIVIGADRVQSAFYLIVPISYLIFYALYKIIAGDIKAIPLLAIFTGLSFHVDFTSVFYPILILCALPFFPKNRQTIKYILLSIPLFIVFLLPTIILSLSQKQAAGHNFFYLFQTYYHGLHLTRVLQLSHDAFISFEQILQFGFFRPFVFLILPVFFVLYYRVNPKKQSLALFFLMVIWIVIPWLVLATYKGEITDYYFSLPRNIAIAILAYFSVFLFQRKLLIIKILPIVFFAVYAINSLQMFFQTGGGNLLGVETSVKKTMKEGKVIRYKDHDPAAYIYEAYMWQKKK